MSQCWKCGQEIPHGAERPDCEHGFRPIVDAEEYDMGDLIEIDFEKVKTFEDYREILITIGFLEFVMRGSEQAKKLARFLKEEKPS